MPRATKRKADVDSSEMSSTSSKRPPPPPAPAQLQLRSQITNIEMLPTEMLLQIFRYVPITQWTTLEAVSPRFRDTTYEVWKSLAKVRIFDDLFASTKYFGDTRVDENRLKKLIDKLTTRATNLCDIGGFWELNLRSMHLIDLKQLRRLDLSEFVNMRVGDLAMFLEESESRDRLRSLCIPDTIFSEVPSSPVVTRLANAFKNVDGVEPLQLEEIRIEKVTTYFARSIGCLLLTIDTSRLTSFLAPGIGISQFQLRSFIERATNLRRLAFSFMCVCRQILPNHQYQNMSANLRYENIRVLEAIGELERLEELTIGAISSSQHGLCHCHNVSDAVIDLFRSIGCRCKPDEDDGTPRRIFRKLGMIQSFAIRRFVEPIAECLPNLERLMLEIDRLDGVMLSTILASQRTLKTLCLRTSNQWTPNTSHMYGGYVRIEDILRSKSTLEELRLDFPCVGKILGDLKHLAQCDRLEKFTFVVPCDRLATELAVDDVELMSWADGFGANLTTLELGGRLFISDKRFDQFLTDASRLECLALSNLHITDELLRGMARSCPKLTELQLRNCEKLSKVGVQAVLDGCSRIRMLSYKSSQDSRWFPSKLGLDKYRRVSFKEEGQCSDDFRIWG